MRTKSKRSGDGARNMPSIILVYPSEHGDLSSIPDEVATVSNILGNVRLVPVSGDEGAIGDAIEAESGVDGRGIVGLWFAGHATKYGEIDLGTIKLNQDALIHYVSISRCQWVFFNVCHGDQFSRYLQLATGVAVVAVDVNANGTGEIEDSEAWRIAIGFARELRHSNFDVERAFNRISPRGASNYVFRKALGYTNMNAYNQGDRDQVNAIEIRLTVLETQMKLQTDQILAEIAELNRKFIELQSFDRATWIMLLASMIVSGAFFAGLTIMIYSFGG